MNIDGHEEIENKDKLFKAIITSGSGVSSSRFVLVVISLASSVLLLVLGFVIVYDCIYDGKIDLSFSDISSIIYSLCLLLGAAGATKVGDSYAKFGGKFRVKK